MSKKKQKKIQSDNEIDIVIPWVDGNDPEWQAEKRKYNPAEVIPGSETHYRNWDNLQYWFRSIEAYAPWVRNIHFITWGHLPDWLNIDHPKLHIVNHKDYIPEQYLPTFSVRAIELNMHKISGLSEKFIYFNDVMFLCKPLKEKDFFRNDLPCDIAALNVHCYALSRQIQIVATRDYGVINEHFDMKKVLKENFFKWFRLDYGSVLLRTLCLAGSPRFPGFYIPHTPQSFLKSTFEKVWNAEYDVLDETCSHKFRELTDVNQWLMKEWQLASGNFVPRRKTFSKVYFLDPDRNINKFIREIVDAIKHERIPIICINDGNMTPEVFEYAKTTINHAFEEKFPNKSSYEK